MDAIYKTHRCPCCGGTEFEIEPSGQFVNVPTQRRFLCCGYVILMPVLADVYRVHTIQGLPHNRLVLAPADPPHLIGTVSFRS